MVFSRKFWSIELGWWLGWVLLVVVGLFAIVLSARPSSGFIPGKVYQPSLPVGVCPFMKVPSGPYRGKLWPVRVYPQPYGWMSGDNESFPKICDVSRFVFVQYHSANPAWGEIILADGQLGLIWVTEVWPHVKEVGR